MSARRNRRNRKARRKSKPSAAVLHRAILDGLDMLISMDWSKYTPLTPGGLASKIMGEGSDSPMVKVSSEIARGCHALGMGEAADPNRLAKALGMDRAEVIGVLMQMTAPDYGCFHLLIAVDGQPMNLPTARAFVATSPASVDAIGWTFMPEPWFAFVLGAMAFARDHQQRAPAPVPVPEPVDIEGFKATPCRGPAPDNPDRWLWHISSPLEDDDYEGWMTRAEVINLFEEVITDPANWKPRKPATPAPAPKPARIPAVGSRRRALLDTLVQRRHPLTRQRAESIGGRNGLYWLRRNGFATIDGDSVSATAEARSRMGGKA